MPDTAKCDKKTQLISPIGGLEVSNVGNLCDPDGKEIVEQEELSSADALWALSLFEKNLWDDSVETMIAWGTPTEQSEFGYKFLKKGLRHLAKELFLKSKDRTGLIMTGDAYLEDGYFDQGMKCYKAAELEPDIISLKQCLEAVQKSKLHACYEKQLELEGKVIGMIKSLENSS
jgi:hypothetical protein